MFKRLAFEHGAYERDDLPKRLSDIEPSFTLISSIWPETYCHTLTESWMAGIPVLASDIGVLRERIDRHGGGWLLDYQDPARWYQQMLQIASDTKGWDDCHQQICDLTFRRVADMAAEYVSVYRGAMRER